MTSQSYLDPTSKTTVGCQAAEAYCGDGAGRCGAPAALQGFFKKHTKCCAAPAAAGEMAAVLSLLA